MRVNAVWLMIPTSLAIALVLLTTSLAAGQQAQPPAVDPFYAR